MTTILQRSGNFKRSLKNQNTKDKQKEEFIHKKLIMIST